MLADRPIRIAPTMLLFPKAADLKDIYWDPTCNLKSELYGTGALGPPNLFSTRDGTKHRQLRKALGGTQVNIQKLGYGRCPSCFPLNTLQWSIGSLKNNWEPRIDELITLFIEKMSEFASAQEEVIISDKVA